LQPRRTYDQRSQRMALWSDGLLAAIFSYFARYEIDRQDLSSQEALYNFTRHNGAISQPKNGLGLAAAPSPTEEAAFLVGTVPHQEIRTILYST
jgi:hypothetical protein